MAFPRRIEIQIYPLFQDFVSCVRRDLKINIEDIKGSLRRIDRDEYPELQRYSDEEIWRDLGPGGLYLVAKMSREMNLKEDDIVLDLGCGRGESSIFLTKHFGVQVIAADLWIKPTYLSNKIVQRGFRSEIIPLNLDALQKNILMRFSA